MAQKKPRKAGPKAATPARASAAAAGTPARKELPRELEAAQIAGPASTLEHGRSTPVEPASVHVEGNGPPAFLDAVDRAVNGPVAALVSAASTTCRLAFILLVKPVLLVLGGLWAPLLVVGLALGAAFGGWSALHGTLSSVASLTSLLTFSPALSALTPLTCALHLYCPPGHARAGEAALNVGKLAHSLRHEAQRANDVFDSVVGMTDLSATGGGLHQTEIWELAMSVRRGSKLEGKEILAQELVELGDLTRDIKDRLIGLNSQGINSFTWLLHSFAVLEKSLLRLAPPPTSDADERLPAPPVSRRTTLALQRQLTSLIARLSSDLAALQQAIEQTLPLAARASALGGRLREEFLVEQLALQESLAREPVWAPLLAHAQKAVGLLEEDGGGGGGAGSGLEGGTGSGFRRDIVKRDMRLAGETVGRLSSIRKDMEDVRQELVGYRENVGWFRAGVVGWFAGGAAAADDDDDLDVQSEMEGLRSIMGRFDGALKKAKGRGGRGGEGDAGSDGSRLLGGERLAGHSS